MTTPRRRGPSKLPRRLAVPELVATQDAGKVIALSRVEAVRRRIANGYYDRDEVRDRLAHAVLEAIREE